MSDARRAGRKASPWVERLARVGFATKGVVYGLVGALALAAAFNEGGSVGGSKNAMQTIGAQPFGQTLLYIIAVGLAGYALWRIVQAVIDPENVGTDGKGIAKRIGYVASGAIHGALCVAAYQMASGGGGGGSSKKTWVAQLLAEPFGAFLVGAGALGLIVFGLQQLHKAWTVDFTKKMKTAEMSPQERTWAIRLGRVGLAARGVILPLMGVFLMRAALQHDASEVKGLGATLREISSQPYGPWLLALVAAGLIAYGVHMLANAKYRRIPAAM